MSEGEEELNRRDEEDHWSDDEKSVESGGRDTDNDESSHDDF